MSETARGIAQRVMRKHREDEDGYCHCGFDHAPEDRWITQEDHLFDEFRKAGVILVKLPEGFNGS